MTRPKVSVIVVSYNRSADLRLSLQAIFDTRYPALEVIVVDNASSDDAADVAASFDRVKLIRNAENAGFAAANDAGLAIASGDYVALVNNDAVVDTHWIDELVSFLESHPEAAAAGGRLYSWNEDSPVGDRKNRFHAWSVVKADGFTPAVKDPPDPMREVVTLSGAAVMIRRAAIDDVGAPFLDPEYFLYYEETDFFARAVRRGWRLYYLKSAECWHRTHGGTEHQPYRYHYQMNKNRLVFVHRHFDDQALSAVVGDARAKAWRATLGQPLDRLLPNADERRALRDAWRWAAEHADQLLSDREKYRSAGPWLSELVPKIEDRSKYHFQPREEVVRLVPESARRVLDVGCGAGGLARALKARRPDVEIRGIEMVREQAEWARDVLSDVLVGSCDAELPASWPRPDCIIFADVLEHLEDPWSVLRRFRGLLAPGGSIVVSIPNALHHSLLRSLLQGRFDYQASGVLDRGHLRFFTRATAVELLEQTGFRVERLERVLHMPAPKWQRVALRSLSYPRRAWEARRGVSKRARATVADVVTIQYLMVAR